LIVLPAAVVYCGMEKNFFSVMSWAYALLQQSSTPARQRRSGSA